MINSNALPMASSQPHLSAQYYKQAFIEAMNHHGLNFRGELIADGNLHRFARPGKSDHDCWYVFFGMSGAFGDWSRGIDEKWSLKDDTVKYTAVPQTAERSQAQEEAADKALAQWNRFATEGFSPYLARKKVTAFGVRFEEESLVVPLRDLTGKLWSFQRIFPDGTKRFLPGGRKKGCCHIIGSCINGNTFYVTEGYATGASVHMATQQTTVVAFDAGNIDTVVEELKRAYPKSPIIIAGDDDRKAPHNVGREKAEQVAQKYGCDVVFPQFKDTETNPTDFNDLHLLEGLEVVKTQLTQPSQVWPIPQPFHTIKPDLLPVIPFPAALIPKPYQPWLVDTAERMQCPLDYMAIGAIIVTASLIGTGCSIRPKRQDSWTVIPNLWGGIIGAPSTLKSPALKEILHPLESLEAQAWQEHEKAQHDYLVELETYKVTKEAIKKDMLKFASACDTVSVNMAKERLRDLMEPREPICKRYSTNDATIEKMHELLSKNPRGLLLFRDELIGLLTSWDAQGHESDRAFYLEAWNGYGSKTTDRIGRGTIYTKNLCISLLGSTQPDKILAYFQKPLRGVENDGLLQRFQLLVYPDTPQEWKLVDRKPNIRAREQASRIMATLTTLDFTSHGATLGPQSDIPYFQFCEQAQGIFYEWLTELEGRLRTSHDESIMIEHLTKYRKLLPSLALIFHLIDIASGKATGSITAHSLERAAAWCDYLESHARRIYALGSSSSSHQAARALARKIQDGTLSGHLDMRDVYRKEWTFLKTKEEVQAAIDVLIAKGWLSEMLCREGKPKKLYRINPRLTIGNPYE